MEAEKAKLEIEEKARLKAAEEAAKVVASVDHYKARRQAEEEAYNARRQAEEKAYKAKQQAETKREAEEKARAEAEKAKKEAEEKTKREAQEKAKQESIKAKEAVKQVEAVPLAERSGHVQEKARLAAVKASQASVEKARTEFSKDDSGRSLFSDTKAKNERAAKENDAGSLFSKVKNFFKW